MPKKPLQFFKDFQKNIPRLERGIAKQILEVEARAQWAKHFKLQAFEGETMEHWPERKKKDEEGKRRALLVKSGKLKTAASKSGRVVGKQVAFTIPLVYANVHNSDDSEDRKAGRGDGFTMPQRKFIGESPALDKRIEEKIRKYLDSELKKLSG